LVNQQLKDDPQYASLSQKKQHARQLSVYLHIRADCWKNESDEIKAEIQKIFDEKHGLKADVEDGEASEAKQDDEDNDDASDGDDDDDDDNERTLIQCRQK
jgi:lysozyme family protein